MSVVAEQTEVEGIERVPGVCGGYPTIAGSRVSVRHVVLHLRLNGGGIEELRQAFPNLTRQQLEAALIYYARFPEAVEEDIERHRRTWKKLTGTDYDGNPVVSR